MHDDAVCRLPRIVLPRTPVNKGVPSSSAPLSVAVSSKAQKVRVGIHQPPVVRLGGFEEPLLGSPSCAEGSHEHAALAAQDYYCLGPTRLCSSRTWAICALPWACLLPTFR